MLLDPTRRLQGLANDGQADSLSHRLRERALPAVRALRRAASPRPLRILDVGGTNEFWEQRGWAGARRRRDHARQPRGRRAAAREHHPDGRRRDRPVRARRRQLRRRVQQLGDRAPLHVREPVADGAEIRRVASAAYWVQTPNFWFPIEPHFLVPAWHWLPEDARVAILRRRGVGWAGRCPDPEHRPPGRRGAPADAPRELARLFPDAQDRRRALRRARQVLDRRRRRLRSENS